MVSKLQGFRRRAGQGKHATEIGGGSKKERRGKKRKFKRLVHPVVDPCKNPCPYQTSHYLSIRRPSPAWDRRAAAPPAPSSGRGEEVAPRPGQLRNERAGESEPREIGGELGFNRDLAKRRGDAG